MQCRNCGDSALDLQVVEDFESSPEGEIMITTQFICETCGWIHLATLNWRDYNLEEPCAPEYALGG